MKQFLLAINIAIFFRKAFSYQGKEGKQYKSR